MRKQHVMVGPELALLVSAFGSAGRPHGFLTEKSHVAIHETHRAIRDECLFQLAPLTKDEALAAGSLEVGPLLDHDRGRANAQAVLRSGGGGW